MNRIIKVLCQAAGLGLVALAVTRLETAPALAKAITLDYNGLTWTSETTAVDVAEVLVTNFGDYANLEISPAPITQVSNGMTITIVDRQAERLNPTVAKNYRDRQVAVATPPKSPAPKPSAPKPADIHSGLATWYRFGDKLTAASRRYPKGTKLRVVAVNSGKSVDVVVNDYGPSALTGIDLDLNVPAFEKIAPLGAGKIKIKYYKIS